MDIFNELFKPEYHPMISETFRTDKPINNFKFLKNDQKELSC